MRKSKQLAQLLFTSGLASVLVRCRFVRSVDTIIPHTPSSPANRSPQVSSLYYLISRVSFVGYIMTTLCYHYVVHSPTKALLNIPKLCILRAATKLLNGEVLQVYVISMSRSSRGRRTLTHALRVSFVRRSSVYVVVIAYKHITACMFIVLVTFFSRYVHESLRRARRFASPHSVLYMVHEV